MSRRYRRFLLKPDFLRDVVGTLCRAEGAVTVPALTHEQLPPDAKVVGVDFDPPSLSWGVTFEHPSFPEVPNGERVPRIGELFVTRRLVVAPENPCPNCGRPMAVSEHMYFMMDLKIARCDACRAWTFPDDPGRVLYKRTCERLFCDDCDECRAFRAALDEAARALVAGRRAPTVHMLGRAVKPAPPAPSGRRAEAPLTHANGGPPGVPIGHGGGIEAVVVDVRTSDDVQCVSVPHTLTERQAIVTALEAVRKRGEAFRDATWTPHAEVLNEVWTGNAADVKDGPPPDRAPATSSSNEPWNAASPPEETEGDAMMRFFFGKS